MNNLLWNEFIELDVSKCKLRDTLAPAPCTQIANEMVKGLGGWYQSKKAKAEVVEPRKSDGF